MAETFIQGLEKYALHIELAAILDIKLYSQTYKYAIKNANSIGLNEIELRSLINFQKTGQIKSKSKPKVEPDFQSRINLLQEFVKGIPLLLPLLTRVQFHSLDMIAICHTDQWGDPKPAIAQSIISNLQRSYKMDKNDYSFNYEAMTNVTIPHTYVQTQYGVE